MPYIKRESRKQYQNSVSEIARLVPLDAMERPGHMNYIVSLLIEKVYGKNMRYAQHNEVVGVLNCIQQEFYRRKTVPYEDQKIESEGDLDIV
ncbi:MAG: hypothetical protein SGJ02_12135 [bacterium]|nr:hypothetical protein [bacterium]